MAHFHHDFQSEIVSAFRAYQKAFLLSNSYLKVETKMALKIGVL